MATENQKKDLLEKNEKPKPAEEEQLEIDIDQVEKIVKRMREKYRKEGVEFEEVSGNLKELRGLVAEGIGGKVEIQTIEELREVRSKLIKFLAGLYLKLGAILKPVAATISKFPEFEMLSFYLYSANMHYSSKQYLALTVSASAIAFVAAAFVSAAIMIYLKIPTATMAFATVLISLAVFAIAVVVMFIVPKQRAQARGNAVSLELPFALRHMSTEIRAGIGLFRTIQAIASSDYGALSDEFARVITEVEEGVDTQEALKHLALRTQSKALRSALIHIVRALKTGGNLSESMNQIAEDVSFSLRISVGEFGQRMNFFGVIFIFAAIVMPVMVTILGSIRNSPIKAYMPSFEMLPLTLPIMAAIYLAIMPFILGMFLFYIKSAQPKV
ncbi:MAG: type II secretion system F family protein [archaeon]